LCIFDGILNGCVHQTDLRFRVIADDLVVTVSILALNSLR